MKFALILLVTAVACSGTENRAGSKSLAFASTDSVRLPDTAFQIKNGLAFHRQKMFNGSTVEYYSSDNLKLSVAYAGGLEQGYTHAFYESGQPEYERNYNQGEKDGIHTGWWANGNKRFEYHFAKGVYNGDFTEWYEDGKTAKIIQYKDGKETAGKGWRNNGKPYMNFIVKDGRRYGLVNAQLCYSVKNEKGEFVESVK